MLFSRQKFSDVSVERPAFVFKALLVSCVLACSSALKIEALHSFETSANFYQTKKLN
jgi:hypothetical protein